MTTKKYLTTVEEVLALKDTDTKIYSDDADGYYKFVQGILCYFYDDHDSTVLSIEFGIGKGFAGRYILVEEPIKDATEEDIGKLCKFWDSDTDEKNISVLKKINKECSYPFVHNDGYYGHCSPLTPAEVAEITGYKVEEV